MLPASPLQPGNQPSCRDGCKPPSFRANERRQPSLISPYFNFRTTPLLFLTGPQTQRVPSDLLTFPQFCVMGRRGHTQSAPSLVLDLIPRPTGLLGFSSNSDDHLLKNIELFDKLSLRFNGRVLFIKDVIGDEICCWSFYGQGRKLAEVCCTSIVYATEKKQTKVWGGLPLPRRGQDAAQGSPSWAFHHREREGIRFALFSPDSHDGAGQGQS